MPKIPNRTPSRRAASKEALKQMHILLGDEKNVEISSDDDIIEVDPPPKKKYKLSHRKSSDGNDRDVIVLKTINSLAGTENLLDLDCGFEELTTVQKARQEQANKEEREIESKIQELLRVPNTEVVYNGVCTMALQISEQLQHLVGGPQAVSSQPIVLQPTTSGGNTVPQSYQLVMDPRLGVIVGTMASTSGQNAAPPLLYQTKVLPQGGGAVSAAPEQPMKTRRGTILRQVPSSAIPPQVKQQQKVVQKAPPVQNKPVAGKTLQVKQFANKPLPLKPLQKSPLATKPVIPVAATPPKQVSSIKPIVPLKNRQPSTITPSTVRPTENSVEGGLSMGGVKPKKSVVDLTNEEGRPLPDSREVSFNKLQGRTYPSLVVVARPHLRVKDLASDRAKLDVKVKSVLMYPPTKFTEWLIQQGLVRSDQKCSLHTANALKLGMYSDASKFPYSGGYVWISECCPSRFVSVFSGSLFEGSPHPPMSILKLLYHWSCQTIVQNVTQWVKVENLFVKGMFTWLRAACTVALHTHVKQLGGPGVKVQVGVISLGTTSQDGNQRQVKVEVLGILETSTKRIRLRAIEPLADGERNYKKRFSKILEPVFNWVHPNSTIVTDLTVDKATLHGMGFMHVTQSTSTDYLNSNRTVMEYLRRIVPRMFQNTLSLLSRQIIQQFLDELVWREWYGTTVMQCFDNMIMHLSEQTRLDSTQTLIVRLNKVIANPFKNWALPIMSTTPAAPKVTAPKGTAPKATVPEPSSATPSTPVMPPKRYNRTVRKPLRLASPPPSSSITTTTTTTSSSSSTVTQTEIVERPAKCNSPDVPEQMVPLENYYYGSISLFGQPKTKTNINIKCQFCRSTFNNNITLMNHLFKHAHNASNDVFICKYCLTIVPTSADLIQHVASSHPDDTKFQNGFVCLVCESQFKNPFFLGKHMSREHCPSELPYVCGTCQFRCSNHKQAVDHFYQQHDCGSTIQCPFCLKSTTLVSGGRNITQNMNYFIQHLQKHQKKHLAKRCGRCNLWFIQKEFLKEHQNKMHMSQRGKTGLIPRFAPRNGVMVPKSRMDKYPDDAKVINFGTLFFNVNKALLCKECDKPLNAPKHFASFESCQNSNCQYSTCCSAAMQAHIAKCKTINTEVNEELLPYEMYCICGHRDSYGDTMAKHLAICERKSAYPSIAAAKVATVTHSMLDVLGLVRKPEEAPASKNEIGSSTKLTEPKPSVTIEKLARPGRPRKVLEISKEVPEDNDIIELNSDDDDDYSNSSDKPLAEIIKDELKETTVSAPEESLDASVADSEATDEGNTTVIEVEKEKNSDDEGKSEKENSETKSDDDDKPEKGEIIEDEGKSEKDDKSDNEEDKLESEKKTDDEEDQSEKEKKTDDVEEKSEKEKKSDDEEEKSEKEKESEDEEEKSEKEKKSDDEEKSEKETKSDDEVESKEPSEQGEKSSEEAEKEDEPETEKSSDEIVEDKRPSAEASPAAAELCSEMEVDESSEIEKDDGKINETSADPDASNEVDLTEDVEMSEDKMDADDVSLAEVENDDKTAELDDIIDKAMCPTDAD